MLIVGPPLLGLVVGLFLPLTADWAGDLRFVPFRAPVRWIATWDGSNGALLGAALGVAFTVIAFRELVVSLTDSTVSRKNRVMRTIEREQVTAVYLDGKSLVLPGVDARLGARARGLARKESVEAAELRTKVARLGHVVRDEQKSQYVRALPLA